MYVWYGLTILFFLLLGYRTSVESGLTEMSETATAARTVSRACVYGGFNECKENEFCINVDKGTTECRSLSNFENLVIEFPFDKNYTAICDQGTLSPAGNSHTWLNTAFAIDLQSNRSTPEVWIQAGAEGRAIVFDECKTENDQCGLGFGNAVKILTEDGHLIFYAHLKKAAVKTGDLIQVGQKIGVEGTTGWTGENNRHLHLSVHFDWRPAGFDYWKQTGFLPPSVPFSINMCKENCNQNCNMSPIDVRNLVCKRTSDSTPDFLYCKI